MWRDQGVSGVLGIIKKGVLESDKGKGETKRIRRMMFKAERDS